MRHIYKILEKDSREIVSLEHVKRYLRISHSHDDELLTAFLRAAVEAAEHYTRCHILQKTVRLYIENFTGAEIDLQVRLLQRVSKIIVGSETIDIDSLHLSNDKIILPHYCSGPLELVYDVGYPSYDSIPAGIVQGILRHVAELYDREGVLLGIPEECISLYTPYRLVSL